MEDRRKMCKLDIIGKRHVPDKATMSLVESPWALNLLIRSLRVAKGDGITPLLASLKLAVFESLLPSLTFQRGPPSYIIINVRYHKYICYKLIVQS
jgi:hypothetical protein